MIGFNYCTNCGFKLNVNDNFCPNCGVKVGGDNSEVINDDDFFLKYKIKQMKSKNVISFDYLCQSVCKLFENDDKNLELLKKKSSLYLK